MKIISSYPVKIVGHNHIFDNTLTIYREAISYVMDVINCHWASIAPIYKDRKTLGMRMVEEMLVTTKNHEAICDFQDRFHKFPSYLRRDVVMSALGAISSYRSNLENWEKEDIEVRGEAPQLQKDTFQFPCFYNKNMFKSARKGVVSNNIYLSDTQISVKIYHRKDWVWLPIQLRKQDIKYIETHCNQDQIKAPTLEKKGRSYRLRFAFEEQVPLNQTKIQDQTIVAVDLGINTDATCAVMNADGTVIARKFINFASEKDHLYHSLNKIRKQQRIYGPKSVSSSWRKAKHYNKELAIKIANAIVDVANEYHADTIVFEYLDFKGRKPRYKKQKLHMWKKNDIQTMVEHKAHRLGIRISRICARNTSALAYDGSGSVKRESSNYQLATFSNGKQYNCDLNASYNIGARFFVREIPKTLTKKVRSAVEAKVPALSKRTICTLSTLISLHEVVKELAPSLLP